MILKVSISILYFFLLSACGKGLNSLTGAASLSSNSGVESKPPLGDQIQINEIKYNGIYLPNEIEIQKGANSESFVQ